MIIVTGADEGFEAIAALKLKSILKGDLMLPQANFAQEEGLYLNPLEPKRQHKTREALLNAISSWPRTLTLELHLTALPDLVHKAQGRIMISLFLRTFAPTRDKAREEIIYRFLNLMPLLAAHLPEAEFVPVTSQKEFEQRKTPFNQVDALTIHRRQETLCLSSPLKRPSLGFKPEVTKDIEKDDMVKHLWPWVPSLDGWSMLMNTLMWQLDPVQVIVRLRPGAGIDNAAERLEDTIRTCELFLSGIKEYQITLKSQTSLIRDVSLRQLAFLREKCFNLGAFVLAPHPVDTCLGNVIGKAITRSQCEPNEDTPFQGGFACSRIGVEDALKRDYFPEKEPFTISEAACAFRTPSPPMENIPGLPVKRSRTSVALLPLLNSGEKRDIRLVINKHQGNVQQVTVGANDRMRHVFLIGQTGTGKSTLLESMILQDIRADRGLAVIDPHGELVESLLGCIPAERADDVILFDILDRERPLGFNLLQWKTPEERDLIIDELYLTLDRIYDMRQTGGPIFEANFRGMLKLLMGEKLRWDFVPTILEFTYCYLNNGFRNWLKDHIRDTRVLDFVEELEKTTGEASLNNLSPYITSKLSRFTNDTTLMRIVGQEKTSFDFDAVMNKEKILLIKLGKGRFGATVSALIANQIVARFKLAAMKRGEMKPEERKDFFMYVDECHNLPRENFIELLSEARKFRMGLTLTTQYAAQLGNNLTNESDLLSAILGNVGTTLIFRLGQQDAVQLAPALYPDFTSLDITGLPNWQGYAHMQLNGESTPPFSFKTEKNTTPYNTNVASRIRNYSRLKYGTDAGLVDTQILKRRSQWKKVAKTIQ